MFINSLLLRGRIFFRPIESFLRNSDENYANYLNYHRLTYFSFR